MRGDVKALVTRMRKQGKRRAAEVGCDVTLTPEHAVADALDAQEREIERLKKMLGECYVLAGADTDGDPPERHAEYAVRAVRELREDYDADLRSGEGQTVGYLALYRLDSGRMYVHAFNEHEIPGNWVDPSPEGVKVYRVVGPAIGRRAPRPRSASEHEFPASLEIGAHGVFSPHRPESELR